MYGESYVSRVFIGSGAEEGGLFGEIAQGPRGKGWVRLDAYPSRGLLSAPSFP